LQLFVKISNHVWTRMQNLKKYGTCYHFTQARVSLENSSK
jgi:hypothetical protein